MGKRQQRPSSLMLRRLLAIWNIMPICRRGHGDPRGSYLGTLEPVHHPSTGWRHTHDRAAAYDVNRHRNRNPKIDRYKGSNTTQRKVALITCCNSEADFSRIPLESHWEATNRFVASLVYSSVGVWGALNPSVNDPLVPGEC